MLKWHRKPQATRTLAWVVVAGWGLAGCGESPGGMPDAATGDGSADGPTGECTPTGGDTWTSMSAAPGILLGDRHLALWTGSEMLIWTDGGAGAAYSPSRDAWRTISPLSGTGGDRLGVTGVWTGMEMIIWGGLGGVPGRAYNPVSNAWREIAPAPVSEARSLASAVWTGEEMFIWGGHDPFGEFADGALYDPADDSWRPVSTVDAPSPRLLATAIWTGSAVVLWGGALDGVPLDDGGEYDLSLTRQS